MKKDKAYQAYRTHKNNSRARGVQFQMTFVQWYKVWVDSGHWEKRGLKGDGYVMSRFNDEGPYHVDNVEIIRASENARQPQVIEKRVATIAKKKAEGTFHRSDDYKHLRDRGHHPKARPVVDPDGVEYPSAALAAEIFGLTRAALAYRCRTNYGGWHYKVD